MALTQLIHLAPLTQTAVKQETSYRPQVAYSQIYLCCYSYGLCEFTW